MNNITSKNIKENLAKILFALSCMFSVFALGSITIFLLKSGYPFIVETGLFNFIFGTEWKPLASEPKFGILPMIITSLYVTAISVIIGVGIGLLTAICIYKFLPKKFIRPLKISINLLAGIPSVIYGLFGLNVIVPFMRDYVSTSGVGYGILSASLVLSVMILPTIISVSLDALQSVPETYYEGALALGSTKEQATFSVMFPSAKSGITAAVALAVGRAIGETMAVMMVLGGSPEMPKSLFQSVRTLTSNIAMGATEMSGKPLMALIASGVILFVFSFILNVGISALKGDKKNK